MLLCHHVHLTSDNNTAARTLARPLRYSGLLVKSWQVCLMDLLYFLKERLRFIEQLYDGAISPFEKTKRKIEEHEPPSADHRDPEYVSQPPFFPEWHQAHHPI